MIESNNAVLMAEYRLLNACYLNPNNIDVQGVNEDVFVHEQSKTIFRSMKELRSENIPINNNSLYQRAASIDIGVVQDQIEAVVYINEDATVKVEDIVKTLNSAKRSIDTIKALEEAKNIINKNVVISEDDKKKIRDLLYESEENVFNDEVHEGVMNLEQWGNSYIEEYKKRINGKIYSFNDPILDKLITTGPAAGCGGLITASSGMGKSSYVLNMINNLINIQVPCMYFSLEMGKVDTYDRLMAIRKQIPFKDIVNPSGIDSFNNILSIVQDEKELLKQYNKFRFCEDPSLTLNDIRSHIMKFQADIGQKYCIVVIDLITMVKDFASSSNGLSLANTIEFAINKMNAIAKELGIHYIGVAQLNRSVEADKIVDVEDINKLRPMRSAIKNSNSLLERCRYVVSLFRPKYYALTYLPEAPETEEMQDVIEVGILKQNNGMTGRSYCLFDGDTFSVVPMVSDSNEDENVNSVEESAE